jgi:hypothetical protein
MIFLKISIDDFEYRRLFTVKYYLLLLKVVDHLIFINVSSFLNILSLRRAAKFRPMLGAQGI